MIFILVIILNIIFISVLLHSQVVLMGNLACFSVPHFPLYPFWSWSLSQLLWSSNRYGCNTSVKPFAIHRFQRSFIIKIDSTELQIASSKHFGNFSHSMSSPGWADLGLPGSRGGVWSHHHAAPGTSGTSEAWEPWIFWTFKFRFRIFLASVDVRMTWYPLMSYKALWDLMRSYEISWGLMRSYEILWCLMSLTVSHTESHFIIFYQRPNRGKQTNTLDHHPTVLVDTSRSPRLFWPSLVLFFGLFRVVSGFLSPKRFGCFRLEIRVTFPWSPRNISEISSAYSKINGWQLYYAEVGIIDGRIFLRHGIRLVGWLAATLKLIGEALKLAENSASNEFLNQIPDVLFALSVHDEARLEKSSFKALPLLSVLTTSAHWDIPIPGQTWFESTGGISSQGVAQDFSLWESLEWQRSLEQTYPWPNRSEKAFFRGHDWSSSNSFTELLESRPKEDCIPRFVPWKV